MLIKKIISKDDYQNGLNYLFDFYPYNIHLLSAFEKTSFNRTLLMLKYDIDNQIIPDISSDKYVEEFICYHDSIVKGIAIKASFAEYAYALDYEEYYIIVADDSVVFQNLLQKINKHKCKFEIITFRNKERSYLQNRFCNSYSHFWNVYLIQPEESIGLCHRFKPSHVEGMTIGTSNEVSPLRYYAFSVNGISGYNVWTYFENKRPIFAASIMPYFRKTAELKIFVINEELAFPDRASDFLKGIVSLSSDNYENAAVRIKEPNKMVSLILNSGHFKLISKEQHIHLEV